MSTEIAGYRFRDLMAARIVSSRSDLNRKQIEHGFPKPIKLSERAAWWPASEVHAWLRDRAALRDSSKLRKKSKTRATATRAGL
jgi:predicted DNA-binding transcriptional regulator AlpA